MAAWVGFTLEVLATLRTSLETELGVTDLCAYDPDDTGDDDTGEASSAR